MCDHFVGTWKLLSSENFEDYMKELGENCYLELLYLGKGRNAEFELYSLLNFTELYWTLLFFFFFLAMLFIKGFLVQLVWLDSVILENFAVWISVVTFLLFKKNLNCKE